MRLVAHSQLRLGVISNARMLLIRHGQVVLEAAFACDEAVLDDLGDVLTLAILLLVQLHQPHLTESIPVQTRLYRAVYADED